jgi:Holliday junction resolvase RusA-like endonuclease
MMKFILSGHITPYTRTTQKMKWTERYQKYIASKEAIQRQVTNQMVMNNNKQIEKGQPFLMECRFFMEKRLYGSDLDNLVKAVADAMNGHAYYDDRYCVNITATKKKADFDYCHVNVRRVTE